MDFYSLKKSYLLVR